MHDGFYIIEARCMPFADESLAVADGPDAFKTRIYAAVESVVMQNPLFSAGEVHKVSCQKVVGAVFAEMAELEGVYHQTIQRMADAKNESYFPDEDNLDDGQRPAIAMKFDACSGRLVAIGVFPQLSHGFHPPLRR